jgi:hypothetical protein
MGLSGLADVLRQSRTFEQVSGKVLAHGAPLMGAAHGVLLVDVQRNGVGDPLGARAMHRRATKQELAIEGKDI